MICCDARVPRRSVFVLVLALAAGCAGILGVGPAAPAQATAPLTALEEPPAAPCKTPTVADNTKAAMAVFTGEVTTATRQDRPDGVPGADFLHEVTVTRVYQGEILTESVQVRTGTAPPSAGECGLGRLTEGTTYMFFVSAGEPWTASGTGGTAEATEELVGKVERLLGEGRDPVPAGPEEAVFTPVEIDEPQSFARVAAPGAALVIIGLLGLVLVRRLTRRS